MGIDWIDDLLQKAEGLPILGGIAHDLRFAYEIWRIDPPDPRPVQNQATNLDDLHTRANTLLTTFNENLLTLQQNWTGAVADYYFGPQATEFEVEHDMEPATTGVGYLLWNRFNQFTAVLEYNRAAHQSAHDTLVKIQGIHGDLQTQVYESAGLLGADVALAATPGAEEADLGTVPATAAKAGEAAQTARSLEEEAQLTEDAEEVEKGIQIGKRIVQITLLVGLVGTIGTIVGVALLRFLSPHSSNPTNAVPISPNIQIGTLTPQEIQELLRQLKKKGITQQDIQTLQRLHPNWTVAKLLEVLGILGQIRNLNQPIPPGMDPNIDLTLATYLSDEGLTPQQVQDLLNRFGLDRLRAFAAALQSALQTQAANTPQFKYFIELWNARNIPGIDGVLNDAVGVTPGTIDFQGALYEIWWIGEHASKIKEVQIYVRSTLNGQVVKGPDVLMDDGTVVQLKAYSWGKNPFADPHKLQAIIDQVTTTRRNPAVGGQTVVAGQMFSGNDIRFELMPTGGCMSAAQIQVLSDNGIYPANQVPPPPNTPHPLTTWEYWPPKPPGNCTMP